MPRGHGAARVAAPTLVLTNIISTGWRSCGEVRLRSVVYVTPVGHIVNANGCSPAAARQVSFCSVGVSKDK